MRDDLEAGNVLDEWAIPRDGRTLSERVRMLARRYYKAQQRAIELEKARDLHVPDYPPYNSGKSA